ncbi:yippee zinc-binding/DNA-binding /Mis18, centromere assembly-domain-containing protein [Aspergillus karnatakaensis]|uniref:yippee/mis18 family protein n=1 Tax=Aspergillus karnatakaensis TaxID=1810916 RepID=UPI003CCCFECB
MFPKFLLPPSIFHTKKQNAKRPSSPIPPLRPPLDEVVKKKYLHGHVSGIRCSKCSSHLCLTTQIISKGFTGRHGRAYLVSAESTLNTTSYPGESLPNTVLQSPVSRHLVTGAHTVSDMDCAFCGSVLGWKYVSTEEESQRYKVGNFILETKKIMITSAWDPAFSAHLEGLGDSTQHAKFPKGIYDGIEFDSQDEEECEDLFSGMWSTGLAVRRRNRKVIRNPSTIGIMSR